MFGFRSTPPREQTSIEVFGIRNFRLFFIGQTASVCGVWMANVAQAWLVLQLTDSGAALGAITGLQALPFVLGSPYGGLIADRRDKRRLLLMIELVSCFLATALAILTAAGAITVGLLGLLAFATGAASAVEIPTRHSFFMELVGREQIGAAVPLNNVMANAGRIVGPALAGLLIGTVGIAACFAVNAASFLAIAAALILIRPAELHRTAPLGRDRGQLVEGFRLAWRTPDLRRPILAVAVVGTVVWQFPVSLPLLARFTFHGGAGAFGLMLASMAVGAIFGGLRVASRPSRTTIPMARRAAVFGAAVVVASLAPTVVVACPLLVVAGAAGTYFSTAANTNVQLASAPAMRGRMIALYTVAFSGTALIGGPLIGAVGELAGARAALGFGGLATLALAAVLARVRPADGAEAAPSARGDYAEAPVDETELTPDPLTSLPSRRRPEAASP